MEKVTHDALVGKTVLNSQGNIIGVILKSMRNNSSGEITSVIVKPSKDVDVQRYPLSNGGVIIVPFSALSSVKDIIVFEDPVK
ncbi:MAG: hypothetical protein BV458_00290 [Thermoplasmata archaeon M9B2D]|nr:MAG: hypothetical protein BV458_00290 [Thermoplasmata archaeon M9B2D]